MILSLPLSFAVAAPGELRSAERASSLASLAESTSVLDAWRDYALADLKPGFSWANEHPVTLAPPSLFDRGNGHLAPAASHFTGAAFDPQPIHVAFVTTKVADTPLARPDEAGNLWQNSTPGLQRYIVSPSVSQRWGENSALSFSVIFAYQRFANIGLGLDSIPTEDNARFATPTYTSGSNLGSYGSGMRADFNSALTSDLSWQVGFQSRVNMDAFNNYRGVYSEPGGFDFPASANAGLGYALTPDVKLDIGVERVMYSQIEPFTSNSFPTRFLVLLGSQISPAFAWQDLNVYSVGMSWQEQSLGLLSLQLSSREQPVPTSPLLQNALEPYLSSYDVEVAFAHAFSVSSSVRLGVTYAPAQFALGVPSNFNLRNNGGNNQIEYAALWTTRF